MDAATARPPRVLLVGCGQIALLAHLPALAHLRESGLVELVGVCDGDGARAADAASRFGVSRSGTGWSEMARETRADAVALCLPPGPNADVSVAALEQGLHVLCEKPPGRDATQAARMAAAAAARPDRITMIAFNRRHAPLTRKALERSRALGDPAAFFGKFTRAGLGERPSNTMGDWITSDGSHALDLAIATMGWPRRVSVSRAGRGEGPDNVWTLHLLGEGRSAILLLGFASGGRVERFEWTGAGYDVSLELPDAARWSAQGGGEETWVAKDVTGSAEYFVNYGFLDEYRAFVDAIGGTAPRPEADFAYGAAFMDLVGTILEASDGATCDVAPRGGGARQGAGTTAPAARRTERAAGTVVLWQPAPARARYFDAGRLAELGSACRLRVAEDGESALEEAEVLVAGWGAPPVTSAQLARASKLRLAVILGASVAWAIPPEGRDGRGTLLVCNTADAIALSVAEHTLLLTLAGLRRLPEVDGSMHAGGWPPSSTGRFSWRDAARRAKRWPVLQPFKPLLKPVAGRLGVLSGSSNGGTGWGDLRGRTVGLVGWGHTARRFAELLEPFGCHVLLASAHARDEELERAGIVRASVGEVFGASRVVSLHAGLNDRTRGQIDATTLGLLRKGTVFVNTARGPLVDSHALLERARRGDVVFALDVFEEEPLPRRHPLRKLGNVILTPHNASSTAECGRRVGDQALDILSAWLSGEEVPSLSPERLWEMS